MSFSAANALQQQADERGLPLEFFSTGSTPFNQGRPPHRLATRAGYGKPDDSILFVPLTEFDKFDAVVTFDHEQFDLLSSQLRRQKIGVKRYSLAKGDSPRLPNMANTPRMAYGVTTTGLFDTFRDLYLEDPSVLDMIHRNS